MYLPTHLSMQKRIRVEAQVPCTSAEILTAVQRQATATRTVAYLRTLQRQLSGVEVTEKALRPAVDPKTGKVSFPDTEAYGEFFDSESW